MKLYKRLLRLTGGFYFLTGIWPVVHIHSFMEVTGPKTDIWLVKTVGLLITALSIGLLRSSFRNVVQPDLVLVVLGFAGFLTAVDIYYNITDVIAPVYLTDAVAEILLILAWLWWWEFHRHKILNKKTDKKNGNNF